MDWKDNKLNEVMKRRSGWDFKLHPTYKDINLLSQRIGMTAGDLLHVYFDLEKEFGIVIDSKNIEKGDLKTYNSILEMLDEKI